MWPTLVQVLQSGSRTADKCFRDEIRRDFVGILDTFEEQAPGQGNPAPPSCPRCGSELGIVRIIRGRPALKINQGTVKQVRI
jgi:hypothetical protein